MKSIDPDAASRGLVAAITDLPTGKGDPDGTQASAAGSLARTVVDWNDPKAWAALRVAAPGWPIRQMSEVIDVMDHSADWEAGRAERLRLLSRFFDSAVVWKQAAWIAGRMLGLRKPTDEWGLQDWEDLVADIRTALAREGVR